MKKTVSAPRPRPTRAGGVEFEYIGGNPVLDFHNTVGWPARGKSHERLLRPVDLVRWAAESGIITINEGVTLRAYSMRNGRRARVELAAVLRLRDLLHDVFAEFTRTNPPAGESVEDLNRRLKKVRSAQALEWHKGELLWSLPTGKRTTTIADRLLLRAADLLTSTDLKRLRKCANPKCGWLFLDSTRNGLRKWCSMSECGGRAKSKRYYDSHKKHGLP